VDPYFARRIQLAVFVIAVLFGLDYMFTPSGSSTAMTIIERTAFPLWLWGAVIIGAGLTGFFVEWRILGNQHPLLRTEQRWRWGWAVNIAHIVLFAVFAVLTFSSFTDIVLRGVNDGDWYGWRTAVMWGGFCYANWQFIRRLGEL
jgi:hypothetical protein